MSPHDAPLPLALGFRGADIPSFGTLNTCVQCGLCLPACPTYRETYREQSSPRGRVHLMKAVYEGVIDVLDRHFVDQMGECLGCQACEAVCPSGVEYGRILEASRAQIEAAREERGDISRREQILRRFVFGGIFVHPSLFRAICGAAGFYQRTGMQRALRASGLLQRLGLAALEQQLPPMSRRVFSPKDQIFPAIGEPRGRAGFLSGCIMQTAFAETDRASVRVLQQNGWEVVAPSRQGCCGALNAHAGDLSGARALAKRNIAAFESAGVDVIAVSAAGCGAALKQYGHLLGDDPAWADRATALSARTKDITEILAASPLRGVLGAIDATVTFQDPCHLAHAQRILDPPRRLLRAIPGLRLIEMTESSLCCGSAGIYSVTHPAMSRSLRERKLDHALATGAEIIVSANPGCVIQLRSGLSGRAAVQVRHVVELLDLAYRRGRTRPSGNAG